MRADRCEVHTLLIIKLIKLNDESDLALGWGSGGGGCYLNPKTPPCTPMICVGGEGGWAPMDTYIHVHVGPMNRAIIAHTVKYDNVLSISLFLFNQKPCFPCLLHHHRLSFLY